MAVTDMKYAVKGLTPQEVWAMRGIHTKCRRLILMSDEIDYTTKNEGTQLDILSVDINGYKYTYNGDVGRCNEEVIQEFPEFIKNLWLIVDETIWIADGELAHKIVGGNNLMENM